MTDKLQKTDEDQIVIMSTIDIKAILDDMLSKRMVNSSKILKDSGQKEGITDTRTLPIGYHMITGEIKALREFMNIVTMLEESLEEKSNDIPASD